MKMGRMNRLTIGLRRTCAYVLSVLVIFVTMLSGAAVSVAAQEGEE